MAVTAAVMLAAVGALSSNLSAVGHAARTTSGALFLERTLEDVAAQPFGNLLVLDGDRIFERTDAGDSRFAIDLDVFVAAVGLVQVRATLVDLRNDRAVGRVVTQRSRR